MKILITICARGGSKGIPGKNVREIGGKPLIAYTIDIAKKFSSIYASDISLSTDDENIRAVAEACGLPSTYNRPGELASDDAGKIDTIKAVLLHEENQRGEKYDMVLDLDVTSPLRTLDDLITAYKLFMEDRNALTLFSVNPSNRNPYFNMVEGHDDGYFHLVKEAVYLTRQSAPKVYDLNASFYFYRRTFFENGQKTPITSRSLVYVMPHICFDLDHVIDFEFLSYLLENDKLDFAIS